MIDKRADMKDKIRKIIQHNCMEENYELNHVQTISENLQMSRNEVAMIVKDLFHKGLLIKIEKKPIIYLNKEVMEEKTKQILNEVYSTIDDIFNFSVPKKGFATLIGSEGSLQELVKQCMATISYPPNGLPMLLCGPTGTGKSLIAKVTYDFAKGEGLLARDGKFVSVNCSEYANNPELLTANLFGHVKGAFTGAEKENPGLISIADGGVLFLDEVHNLKAECQEKLFQFMDQSIYHRVGNNEKWYTSNVRIVFATTEDPEKVLLKTLQRRIPITIVVPSLEERGIQERIQLLYYMLQAEQTRLQKKIRMSNKVYQLLLSHEFTGNIGGLKSCVQSCCVNSLFTHESTDVITIQLASLPKYILENYANKNQVFSANSEYISVDEMQHFIQTKKELIQLSDSLLQHFIQFQNNDLQKEDYLESDRKAIKEYFDSILFKKEEKKETNFYQNGIQHIFDLIMNQYGLKIQNNDLIAVCSFLDQYYNEYHHLQSWEQVHQEECKRFIEFMKDEYYREFSIASEIAKYLSSYLDREVVTIAQIILLLYIQSIAKEGTKRKKIGVILAHGFSTASSIADAANQFLETYVFDAIDMPLNVDTNTIVQRLNTFLSRVNKFDELILLVDMGSLEDIYKGLHSKNANIGIINNVSTKTALEVGSGILQDKPMEEIFKNVVQYINVEYHIEKHKSKESVILCSCASGMGTAEKLRKIIQDSLPINLPIEVKTYHYNALLEKGMSDAFFEDYHVICVIGTLNPNIDELNFIAIEDLIVNDCLNELDGYLDDYMDEVQLDYFKKNILRNFSLSNIMNSLTILNPNKLLEHVADAIDRLQSGLNIRLHNKTCFGLYVHISCMMERLVMQRDIEVYGDMEKFEKENTLFIVQIKKVFKEVESYYGVSIPVSEIGYIYDYIKHDLQ